MLQLQADNGYPKDLDAIMAKVKEQKYVTVVSKKKDVCYCRSLHPVARYAWFFLHQAEENMRERSLWKSSTVSPLLCAD